MGTLLVPDARDRHDAHGYPEADEEYKILLRSLDPGDVKWEFSLVSGYFKQADDETDDMKFEYIREDFGRKKLWSDIRACLEKINAEAAESVRYKVLFLARHGQGWHNIASAKYLAQEWHDKWRFLGDDGAITWGPDPKLTDLGVEQARDNGRAWSHQLQMGAPIPSLHYVSPLERSCHTLHETWQGVEIGRPIVSELVRETNGLHLCHKRSCKDDIAKRNPSFRFEPGFTDRDELFEAFERREHYHEQFLRANMFLQQLFERHPHDHFVSITSHAGMIRAFISVIGHRKFTVPTGGMVPVVVRAERKYR